MTNPRWQAPEVLKSQAFSPKSDVYSYGIIMWEMLTWQLPWPDYV